MQLEEGLKAFLANDAQLTAQVDNRIYPVMRPEATALPAVTYQCISRIPEFAHDGESDTVEAHFQLSSFGATYAEAKETARRLKNALRPFMKEPGLMGSVQVGGVILDNEIDVFDAEEVAQLAAYHVLGEYTILAYGG